MPHQTGFDVSFENIEPVISSKSVIKLRWLPESILPVEPADSYTVDISLREFNATLQEWHVTDIIATDLPNTGYAEVTAPEFNVTDNYNDTVSLVVVEVGVSEASINEVQTRKRGIFSKIFKAIKRVGKRIVKQTVRLVKTVAKAVYSLTVGLFLRAGCEVWGSLEDDEIGQQILRELPPCPCTERQIRQQMNLFEEENTGQNFFHPGTSSCFRQRTL